MAEPIDPLIAQPPGELRVPPGLTDDEKVQWVFEAALDHVNLHAMAWPARDRDGVLQPPPDEHVLDYLAHSDGLVDEEQALSALAAGTIAVLQELPACDVCQSMARYDGPITDGEQTGGAYMCPDCYTERGSGSLGASGDVYLMTFDEVSDWVRDRYDTVAEIRGKPALP